MRIADAEEGESNDLGVQGGRYNVWKLKRNGGFQVHQFAIGKKSKTLACHNVVKHSDDCGGNHLPQGLCDLALARPLCKKWTSALLLIPEVLVAWPRKWFLILPALY